MARALTIQDPRQEVARLGRQTLHPRQEPRVPLLGLQGHEGKTHQHRIQNTLFLKYIHHLNIITQSLSLPPSPTLPHSSAHSPSTHSPSATHPPSQTPTPSLPTLAPGSSTLSPSRTCPPPARSTPSCKLYTATSYAPSHSSSLNSFGLRSTGYDCNTFLFGDSI